MLRRETLRGFLLLLSTLPVTMANSFIESPDVVRGDVSGSAVLEWRLQSVPGRDDFVSFNFNRVGVLRYTPYTGVIHPPLIQGPDGNPQITNVSFYHRFTIYNTSTSGVGFRLAGLTPEDAGNYTCRYYTLIASINMDAVLFVYDVPGRPVIAASPQKVVEGVTIVSLECGASSTSLQAAHRPAMLYTWSRNGVDIDMNGPPERHAVLGDSGQTLEITPVHHTDTMYTCTASKNGTQLTSEEIQVTLDVLHGPYSLTINPRNPSARQDESLEITASAACNPACSFTWSIGDDVISHGPFFSFDKFQSRDAKNYTVRAENTYGTAKLTVEVTLDKNSEGPAVSGGADDVIIGVVSAVACVSLIVNVFLATVAFRRGLFSCRKGDPEPGYPAAVYVNAGLVREPGKPAANYVNAELIRKQRRSTGNQNRDTEVAYEVVTPTHRDPAHPADMVREDGLDIVPVTPGGHHSPGVGGVYEPVDRRTREPVRPADKVTKNQSVRNPRRVPGLKTIGCSR